LVQMLDPDFRHRSLRELRDDDEQRGADERRQERIGVECQRDRLQQHENAGRDDHGRKVLPRAPPQADEPTKQTVAGLPHHLRTAPKVIPRRRCLRSRTVKTRIGIRKRVVPALTAGQSWPPSPMMIGMKGGAVCASPEVSSTAKAYSFQAKIMQKIAVAAMPVVACGSTTLKKACSRL